MIYRFVEFKDEKCFLAIEHHALRSGIKLSKKIYLDKKG